MKKLIIPLILSAPLFFTSSGFAASNAPLYNPESRTNSTYLPGANVLPKASTTYAYWRNGYRHGYRHGYYGHRYYGPRHYRYWNNRYYHRNYRHWNRHYY